jgi:hypothetical protein
VSFKSINIIFFVSILVCHFTTALHPLPLAGIHLQLYDFLIVGWIIWFLLSKQKVAHQDLLFVFPFTLFGLWAYGISVPQGNLGSLTIFIQLLRSLAFFVLTAALARSCARDDFRSLIAAVFKLVVMVNVLAWISSEVGIYSGAFEDGNFNTKRFEGFANDSNFVGGMILILAALSLTYVSNVWLILAILLCVLTGSRTVIGAVGLFLGYQILRQASSYGAFRFWTFISLVLLCNLILLEDFWFGLYDVFVNTNFIDGLAHRFTVGSPRFAIWEALVSDMLNPVNFWGSGLRSTEEIVTQVSRNRYSHNSFLDIAYEYGWVPCIYLLSVFFVLLVKSFRKDSAVCFALVVQLMMLMTLSIFYLPFMMFVLSVAWTRVSIAGSRTQHADKFLTV